MGIGEILKKQRLQRGYSQEDVAKELFVSRQTISNWELAKTYPDIEKLIALSDFYEVSLDVLVKEDKKMLEKVKEDSQAYHQLRQHKKWFYFSDHVGTLFFGAFLYCLWWEWGSKSDHAFSFLLLALLCWLVSLYNWTHFDPDQEYWFGRWLL